MVRVVGILGELRTRKPWSRRSDPGPTVSQPCYPYPLPAVPSTMTPCDASGSPPGVAIPTLALLMLLALSSCGQESAPRWTPAAVLDETVSDFARVDLGMDANGGAIAIWSRRTERGLSATDYTIWAGRFAPGEGWEAPTKLGGQDGGRGATDPQIAVNAEGNAVAAWHEWARDGEDQTGEGVWAARFDRDTGWEDPVFLGEDGYSPSVALNDHGQAVLVWWRSLQSVWASRLEPGAGWSAARRLDRDCIPSEAPGEFPTLEALNAGKNPNVAINDSGYAIATWYDNESEAGELGPCNASLSLRASEYAPDSGWSAPVNVGVRSTLYGALQAPLSVDASGRALAGSLAGEVSSYSVAEGWGTLDLGFGDAYGRSSVAMSEGGEAVVVFEVSSDAPIYPEAVRAVRFSPGSDWTAPELLSAARDRTSPVDLAPKSPTVLDSSGVDVAINDAGHCVVAWHEVGNPTARPPPFSVWTNSHAPGRGWSAPTMLSTGETVDATFPQIAVDPLGRGLAVWIEVERAGDWPRPARLMWSRLD